MAGNRDDSSPAPSASSKKRQRSLSRSPGPPSKIRREDKHDSAHRRHAKDQSDELPQPFDAKKLSAPKRQAPTTPVDQGRKQKRPGQRARIREADLDQIRQRANERERARESLEGATPHQLQHANSRTPMPVQALGPGFVPGRAAINDVVRAHYNAVPERGRDWRKTDSRIRGLRSFNNWVKSCIIQKFAPDDDFSPGAREMSRSSGNELLVLDIGCGKGGDLGKWQQAPQKVQLYVGLDPAEVSIEQARDRYRNMSHRGGGGGRGRGRGGHNGGGRPPPFEARLLVKDCFGESLGDLDIVRQVGFSDQARGPSDPNRGFDVVSMMFCLHYSFETEAKTRQMLRNVSGALKKGGRFIGTIPSSDVIASRVEAYHKQKAAYDEAQQKAEAEAKAREKEQGERPKSDEEEAPPSPSDAEDGELVEDAAPRDGLPNGRSEVQDGNTSPPPTAEWGNDIYRVRFPGATPADGIFRPPFGWKYSFFLHEAVEEVPEYVVPWEAFRALAEDYNLELQYHKSFAAVWEAERDDRELGPLSERMGVRERGGAGALLVSPEEMEAASFYSAFCFYKV